MDHDFESACVAGLEVHVFRAARPAETAPTAAETSSPVVFVTHGRGGRLKDTHALCRRLRARGLTALGVEQRNHGRRLIDAAVNDHGPTHATDMYGLIVGMAQDLSLLLDFVPARLGLPCERAGVTGVSLGGHVALMAMGLDVRFKAGVAFIGSGDYRALMRSRKERDEFASLAPEVFFSPALAACVDRYDPINRPAVFADRPLLLANGGEDTLVPLEGNQNFEAAIRPFYRDATQVELAVYPGVGHEVTEQMEEDAVDWLVRYLTSRHQSPML